MQINQPTIVAEIVNCHTIYEKALLENDVATLESLFWDSPHVVRYDINGSHYGHDGFDRSALYAQPAREITRIEITALGEYTGIVNLEFAVTLHGAERHGRQTQFWRKFPEGWRIVSAHASLVPDSAAYNGSPALQNGYALR